MKSHLIVLESKFKNYVVNLLFPQCKFLNYNNFPVDAWHILWFSFNFLVPAPSNAPPLPPSPFPPPFPPSTLTNHNVPRNPLPGQLRTFPDKLKLTYFYEL